MKWSEEAWKASEEVFNQITRLPFLEELAKGTLSMDKFNFYINQDSQYLEGYSKSLAHIASRLKEKDDMLTFLRFASDGVAIEQQLHEKYIAHNNGRMSWACLFYTSFLAAQRDEDVAVECAAVLPCFWVYQKVGQSIIMNAKMEGNHYRDWITTYADPSFDESTRKAIDVCDRLAAHASPETRRRMTEAFLNCTRMELLFWDTAYRLEYWPK